MAVNKVVYGNTTLIDLTDSNLTSDDQILSGTTAYDRSGVLRSGTAQVGTKVYDGDDTSDPVYSELFMETIVSGVTDALLNTFYPVGSIYMSVNSTNPSTLFGGTWQQLQNRFLLGAGSTYTAGDTGGSSSQTVNFNNGQANIGFYPNNTGGIYMIQNANTFKATNVAGVSTQWGGSSQSSCKPASLSGTQTLNNMPPYLVVYMWKRTA